MLLSRLFPKVDFEAEFFCSNELAAKLEHLEKFCSALVPRERILSFFSTRRLGHVEIAALAGAIEAAQIDPFESSDPHIRIALLAGMISEGYEIDEVQSIAKWSVNLSTWCNTNCVNAELGWLNLAFKNPESGLARLTRQALARHCIKHRRDLRHNSKPVDINMNLKLYLLSAVAYDSHPVMPAGLELEYHHVVTSLFEVEIPSNEDCYRRQLSTAVQLLISTWSKKFWSIGLGADEFLFRIIPLFVTTWLHLGIDSDTTIARAQKIAEALFDALGISSAQASSVWETVLAVATISTPKLFRDRVKNPDAVIGFELIDTNVAKSLFEEITRSGVAASWMAYGNQRQVAQYLQLLGVELVSDRTRAKAGFQAIPWPLIAAQGVGLSAMEEMYYPIIDGACIPAWIHNGKEFTPGLSLPFLSEVVFHIANSEEAFVTIGGYKKVRSDILESLADVDDKVLLTAIFAIDAAGALTESLISSLGLDAEVLGARNLAALSPRVRGIIVSQAVGV